MPEAEQNTTGNTKTPDETNTTGNTQTPDKTNTTGNTQTPDETNKNESADKSEKFSIKDLYNEFFHCRDFEISNLWQRSVFLAVFLIALLTAYGTFVNQHFDRIFINYCKTENGMYQIACIVLCTLGIMFSQLWIMMAKGSKMWYERYEKSISWFYEKGCHKKDKKQLFDKKLYDKIKKDKLPYFGNLCDTDSDDSLLSTKAGAYSVSRINCAIGIILCAAWIFLDIVHFRIILAKCLVCCQCPAIPWIVSTVFILGVSVIFSQLISLFTKSGD